MFFQVFNLGKYPTGIQTFSIFNVEEFESNLCGEREKSWSVCIKFSFAPLSLLLLFIINDNHLLLIAGGT
jgi:hypothetical protein